MDDSPTGLNRSTAARLELFSVLWACGALLHTLGNPRGSTATLALLACGFAAVMVWPGALLPLAGLSLAVVLVAWSEAPGLPNHWMLMALVSVGIVVAAIVCALSRDQGRDRFAALVVTGGQISLLVFYAFAAFAKINSAFFDPDVSCAVHFLHETTNGLGFDLARGAAWEAGVPFVIAGMELLVAVLLAYKRTRALWLPVALAFHFVLAVDRPRHVYDFSSALLPLFLLLLGSVATERAVSAIRRLALARAVLAVAGGVLILAVAVADIDAQRRLLDIGFGLWLVLGLATLALAVTGWREGGASIVGAPLSRRALVAGLVAPGLVLANGLTPYLEIKNGYAWIMYSNLQVVDGETNHLLLPGTLPLTDEQEHLIEILDSDDPVLLFYVERDYALTERQLRIRLADHPEASITYRRDGRTVHLDHASDDPRLVRPVPTWEAKLLVHRAADLREPWRCQDTFGVLG